MYNLFICYVLLIRSVSFVYHFKFFNLFAKWQPQNMALDTSSHVCSSPAMFIDFNVMNDFLELDTFVLQIWLNYSLHEERQKSLELLIRLRSFVKTCELIGQRWCPRALFSLVADYPGLRGPSMWSHLWARVSERENKIWTKVYLLFVPHLHWGCNTDF